MYLISETTKEEREAIVKESLGHIEASCDGCVFPEMLTIGKINSLEAELLSLSPMNTIWYAQIGRASCRERV